MQHNSHKWRSCRKNATARIGLAAYPRHAHFGKYTTPSRITIFFDAPIRACYYAALSCVINGSASREVPNPCNGLVPHRRGVFMGFWCWLFGRSRTPDLGLSDGWKPLGNFFEGLHCPLCGAGPGENGLNFFPLVDESGPRLDVMMHMPLLHRAKVALCKKCKGRYEWKWIPQEQTAKDLFIVWRPAPPVPCPIPANATPEERADWELWLQASAAGTTEAFEAYLRDSRLRLFESEANTLLRWKNSMAKPT